MKMPESIRLQGIDFTIEKVKDLVVCGTALYGSVYHGESKIRISTNEQLHQRQCTTLWHELLHAICEMNSIELGSKEETERIIDIFSFGIYQVLEDNIEKFYDIAEMLKETGDANNE